LPTPLEYAAIVAGVPRRERTPDQRRLMRAATRRHGLLGSLIILAAVLFVGTIWYLNGEGAALLLVRAILAAKPDELRKLIDESLPPFRRWADPRLEQLANAVDTPPGQRLRARLALVPVDGTQVGFLSRRLVECPVDEFPVVRDYLQPYAAT